jgi:hypothetical protein
MSPEALAAPSEQPRESPEIVEEAPEATEPRPYRECILGRAGVVLCTNQVLGIANT